MINKIFAVLILYTAAIFAQPVPQNYKILQPGSAKKLLADNAANPAGNSITDIITSGDTVWLGGGKGLSLSTDRGNTWTNFYNTPVFGDNDISAIGLYHGIFFAAKAYSIKQNGEDVSTGGGIAFTTDGGANWKTIPQPVDDPGDSSIVYGINNGTTLPRVRALPVTVPQQNLTYDIAFTPNTIWIASFAGGLRKARIDSLIKNPNYKWERVLLPADFLNSVSPGDTIRFSLQPVAGKFGTEDYLNHRLFSVIATDDNTLYAGTAGGINKSIDNGVSWTRFTHANQQQPISGNFVVALGYHKEKNTVWGATWRAEGTSEFYGVSSSTDAGETWQTALEEEKVHNFGFTENSVIAAADDGAFRSSDNGVLWILPSTIVDAETKINLPQTTFYSAASSGNNVWVGTSDGLAKLNETGSMWQGDWKVYIASQPLASKTETYAYPNPFSPATDMLKIKYSTGGRQVPVTIRIFDFGMNYIRTVVQNAQRGGELHRADTGSEAAGVIDYWDGRDDAGNIVRNGVYFYRVEAGSDEPVFGKILVIR